MKSEVKFIKKPLNFWGNVRFLSEALGYSVSANAKKNIKGRARYYEINECINEYNKAGLTFDLNLLMEVVEYLNYRSEVINTKIHDNLMNLEQAKELYDKIYTEHYVGNDLKCKLPTNKQKNEKSGPAYFTCMINILTEVTIRNYCNKNNITIPNDGLFDTDPQSLSFFTDETKSILNVLSRRFDGAFPSTTNPLAIWEIKEYYYTTTFGSRIADGVYETLLDGFEINLTEDTYGGKYESIKHYYLIDARDTWYVKGKSYLCRIVDMLHMGYVDDVLFGKEIINEWPSIITALLDKYFLGN